MDQEARILGSCSRHTETTYQDNWCVVGSMSSLHFQTGAQGICFGHQIVARALGGKCVSNSGKWEVAITEVALTDLGQRIFGAQSLACSACPRICILNDVFDRRTSNKCTETMFLSLRHHSTCSGRQL